MDDSKSMSDGNNPIKVLLFLIFVTLALYYFYYSLGPSCHCGDRWRHEKAAVKSIIFFLSALVLGVYSVKKGVRKSQLLWVIPIAILLSMLQYQLENIDNCFCSEGTHEGFSKIRPQMAGVSVSLDGKARFMFTNTLPTDIRIASVTIQDQEKQNFSCVVNLDSTSARYGYNFEVLVPVGCIHPGETNEWYTTNIVINYAELIDGRNETHTDTGIITGPYE